MTPGSHATIRSTIALAATSRIAPIARTSWTSDRRPVRRAPSSAPGIDAAAPTAATV
jgi:hypothetical protein